MAEKQSVRTRMTAVTVAAVLALAACSTDQQTSSNGNDKAGGTADPVVLTMANTDSGLQFAPAVEYFVNRVEDLSGGSVRIEVSNEWGNFAADAEQQVVTAVTAGDADLGFAGTVVFDTLGVTSLRALIAPMLIDSYPLQEAVIASGIPGEMLTYLEEIGVTGVAVLANRLQKPIAVEAPLLSPADFDGITFQAYRSQTHADALHALGAEQTESFGTNRTAGLTAGEIDGFEMNLNGFAIMELAHLAPYVTANLNLWAQPVVVFANPEALDELSEAQRRLLMQAGAEAVEQSVVLVGNEADQIAPLCEMGARFANASDADLESFRQVFAPVYATLEQDPPTKRFIEQIEALKEATDPGPALSLPAECTGPADDGVTAGNGAASPASEADAAALNGTYRWTLTADDAIEHDQSEELVEELATSPWIFTVGLDDGIWTMAGECDTPDCTYAVYANTIVFDWHKTGSVLEFTFTTDADGTLHLHPTGGMNPGDQFVWTTKPWEKLD
jgi:TRAP-type C4-dicarboxylate transport system substrate-binding protein